MYSMKTFFIIVSLLSLLVGCASRKAEKEETKPASVAATVATTEPSIITTAETKTAELATTPPINTPVKSADSASVEESLGLYEEDKTAPKVNDPLESFNRAMFTINDALFLNFIKPVGSAYSTVVPEPVRKSIGNAYRNIGYPGRVVNSALQGKVNKVGYETEAFIVNTVFGVGGLFAASDKMLDRKLSPEDTNQTLAVWGIDDGFYLCLPLLGPTTLRGVFGQVGDSALYPITYVDGDVLRMVLSGEERLNAISFRIKDYDALKESSVDPYSALKDAYIQNTEKMIKE